ncbi:MAG: Class II aldolase/adducin family protein [Acetothermia bacterium 64_32]|nr:MAG: Class II aldolase/adducin family protein [Acetothermia bacterium 64_32]
MLDDLRHEVWNALLELPRSGLVQGTSGNVSGRKGDLVVIKPSGVPYDKLRPEDLVVVDLEGNVVEGSLKPSVDTPAHLEIYKAIPDVGGVVHTHSTYATVFAVLGRELPVYTTELADFFGGPIPISEYVPPGDRGIGLQFARKTRPGRYRALIMRSHGVFTAGKTPADAVKAAVIVEHSAKIACLAELLGKPSPLPPDEIEKLHERYIGGYGQRKE